MNVAIPTRKHQKRSGTGYVLTTSRMSHGKLNGSAPTSARKSPDRFLRFLKTIYSLLVSGQQSSMRNLFSAQGSLDEPLRPRNFLCCGATPNGSRLPHYGCSARSSTG